MKAKIEYIIPILIIIAVSIYLFVQKSGKTHYSLPDIQKIEKNDISKLTVKKGDSEIVLVKENDKWFVGPKQFLADSSLVDKMFESICSLTLSALVSESKNYFIYDLDEKNRIKVEAYKKDKVLRRLKIGKPALSHRHTFIKLDNDHRVYHCQGNITNLFTKTIPELRNKEVMSIDEEITELTLKKGNAEITVRKLSIPPSADIQTAKDKKEKESIEPQTKWMTDKDIPVKETEINEIVTTLSKLRCDSFIEDKTKEDFVSAIYSVSLKGINTYSISIFDKTENKYSAISSQSKYPFYIVEWKAKKIMKELDSLKEE
jgi:hypothetical protein